LFSIAAKRGENVGRNVGKTVSTSQITTLKERVRTLEKQNEALAAQVEVLQQDRDHWKEIAEKASEATAGSPG
jgi:cell division protein FtsB